MNTYSVVEAPLKTRHFIPFRIRTYRKSLHNAFEMNTYKKPRGVGEGKPVSAGPAWLKTTIVLIFSQSFMICRFNHNELSAVSSMTSGILRLGISRALGTPVSCEVAP
jgi:hypothetical protein